VSLVLYKAELDKQQQQKLIFLKNVHNILERREEAAVKWMRTQAVPNSSLLASTSVNRGRGSNADKRNFGRLLQEYLYVQS
jgi:hypothetical protein